MRHPTAYLRRKACATRRQSPKAISRMRLVSARLKSQGADRSVLDASSCDHLSQPLKCSLYESLRVCLDAHAVSDDQLIEIPGKQFFE